MKQGAETSGRSPVLIQTRDRREFLRTLYGATLGVILAACSRNDAEVFAAQDGSGSAATTAQTGIATDQDASKPGTLRVQTDEQSASPDTTSVGDTTSTTADQSVSSTELTTSETTTSSSTSSTSSTSSGGGTGGALPAGATMVVSFTYQPQPSGKNMPPYVAVWIEDGSGNLATTVALWYQQFGRGERWLPDLTRWYNVDQSRIAAGGGDTVDAISGPTRSPGGFQVAWNGQINGSAAPAGSYFLCIESARERGPYSLIRQSVNLDGSTQQQDLSGDGELIDASFAIG